MLAALLFFNALLGTVLATVLLRAGWSQRQNQLLAQAALLDGALAAALGALAFRGISIASPVGIQVYVVGRLLVCGQVLRFLHVFPRARPVSAGSRALIWITSLLAVVVALVPETSHGEHVLSCQMILIPISAFCLRFLVLGKRQVGGATDAKHYSAFSHALLLRWVPELVTYQLVLLLWPSVFSTAFALNATAITLIGHMSLTLVVLRQPSFRVRGLLAETGLLVALGLFTVSVTVFLLDLVARSVQDPLVRGLAYALTASAPCAVLFAMQRYAPALESVLLNRLNQRRSHAQKLLQQLLVSLKQALGKDELYRLTTTVLAELSASEVRFCHSAAKGGERLPVSFVRYWERRGDDVLSADQCQPSAEAWADLRADLLVAVRAEGELCGAFALRGGELDVHTLELAKAVAAQLGTKLAREALCERASQLAVQLESSRQLATLGSFVAAVAHDIRTPLTSVRLNLQMLGCEVASSSAQACVQLATRELDRMGAYVQGMLDFVKPVQLCVEDITVQNLVAEATELLRACLESRKQRLHIDLDRQAAEVSLRVDGLRMRQVLANLVENASEASGTGTHIGLRVRRSGTSGLSLSVIDSGEGICADDMPRLFEPFFTTRRQGTGLGLAIVRRVVEAHGGSIAVSSTARHGSTFEVVLPLHGEAKNLASFGRVAASSG